MVIGGIQPTVIKSLVPLTTSHIATAFGLFEMMECLGKTVGGPLVGLLKDIDGTYGAALASFVCLLCVAGALGAVTLWTYVRREAAAAEYATEEGLCQQIRFLSAEEEPRRALSTASKKTRKTHSGGKRDEEEDLGRLSEPLLSTQSVTLL